MKSRNKFLSGLLLFSSFVIISAVQFCAADSSTASVYVNGSAISFDASPEIVNGRMFVPMKAIFEALGAEVSWSEARNEAAAEIGSNEVVFKIGSEVGLHNTEASTLDAAPYIKKEHTMVPLRYLSESLGYEVKWNASERTVSIDAPTFKSDSDRKTIGIMGDTAGLTYADAIKRYDKVNPAVQRARLASAQSAQSKNEFNEVYTWIGTYTLAQTKKNLTLASDWAEKQITMVQAQGAYSITTSMDKVSLKIAEIAQKKTELQEKKKAFEIVERKFYAGASSAAEVKTAENAVKTAELDLENANTELQGLYVSLYGSLEYEQGKYDVPEYKVEYKPIGKVDLKKKYEDALKEDPYIWYLEHARDNAKYTLDTYEYNVGEKSYTMTSMDLTAARINLGITKQQLKDTIYKRYNQIIQIENGIAGLNEQISTLRDNIDTLRTNYQYGAASKYTLETALQGISSIKYQRMTLENQHLQLMRIFETPWLAPEYMSAG